MSLSPPVPEYGYNSLVTETMFIQQVWRFV